MKNSICAAVFLVLAGGSVLSAPDCAAAELPSTAGPKTTVEEFYGKCLDYSIPDLQGIPARLAAGDEAGANRIFADYVRKTLDPRKVNRSWYEGSLTAAGRANLKKAAEKVMDYQVAPCGVPHHFKDHHIDWRANPTYNGYREWPVQLGRQKFFSTLAAYYTRMGGDERAARTWREMLESWIDQAYPLPDDSPPGKPITWRTLDAGLRVSGWCHQIHAFVKSPSIDDAFIARFFRAVRDHGVRLEPSLTKANWRIMELNGLLQIAMTFPFLSESARWREKALAEFREQLELQVYPDGFQFELTPGYHGVIPNDYGNILKLFAMCGEKAPDFVLKGIEGAYDMYPHLTRPDRRTPPLNDSGPVAIEKPMVAASKLYPDRADFLWFATDGKKGRPPEYLSYAFPYAGAAVFRTSWARDAVWGYMDCSPYGRGHQHEDRLNVLISAYGKNMLIEPGNYAYDTSEMRKYVLSTRAHNAILVDGREQLTRRVWKWKPEYIKKKSDFYWLSTPDVDCARAAYTPGFGIVPDCVRERWKRLGVDLPRIDATIHTRTTMFFKNMKGLPPFFVYVDRLQAPDDRERTYDSMWHLNDSTLTVDGSRFTADFGDGIGLAAAFSDKSARIVDMKGTHVPYQGWIPISPPGPHEHHPIPTPVLKGGFSTGKRIVGVFCPYRGGTSPIVGVDASPDPADMEFKILLRDGGELRIDELETTRSASYLYGSAQEAALKKSVPRIIADSATHYRSLVGKVAGMQRNPASPETFPYSWNAAKDKYTMRSTRMWTSGHFPGTLWLLHEATGDVFFKDAALRWTEALAPNAKVDTHHDVGFIINCSFGNARRLMKTDRYDALIVEAANSLSSRFNRRLGLIRSGGKKDDTKNFIVIPDNLMNLELLEVAKEISGDRRFDEIARSHADVTSRRHFRSDGGCFHVLDYDQSTGRIQKIRHGQGVSTNTAWARGESWAVYGYTMMYRKTREARYLKMAQKCADFAIGNPNMPEDGVPYWDYGAPYEERDSSAGAILASALLELSGFVGGDKGARYRAFAVKTLATLASPGYFAAPGENGDFLLKHGVGSKPGKMEVDAPLNYGDYYFIEAIQRFQSKDS